MADPSDVTIGEDDQHVRDGSPRGTAGHHRAVRRPGRLDAAGRAPRPRGGEARGRRGGVSDGAGGRAPRWPRQGSCGGRSARTLRRSGRLRGRRRARGARGAEDRRGDVGLRRGGRALLGRGRVWRAGRDSDRAGRDGRARRGRTRRVRGLRRHRQHCGAAPVGDGAGKRARRPRNATVARAPVRLDRTGRARAEGQRRQRVGLGGAAATRRGGAGPRARRGRRRADRPASRAKCRPRDPRGGESRVGRRDLRHR